MASCCLQRCSESALSNIARAVGRRSFPSGSVLKSRAVLHKLLLRVPHSYIGDVAAGALAPYQRGLVSLHADGGGCDLLDVLGKGEATAIDCFEQDILLPPHDYADRLDVISEIGCYRDPVLDGRIGYAYVVRCLIIAGIAGPTPHQRTGRIFLCRREAQAAAAAEASSRPRLPSDQHVVQTVTQDSIGFR